MNRALNACLLAAALPVASVAAPVVGGCPVFPANHYWNTRVDRLPVHPLSATWMAQIGTGNIRNDWGITEKEYGIPYSVVPGSQTAVPILYGVCDSDGTNCEDYNDESDPGPYPIPPNAPIEGGNDAIPDPLDGDRHTLTINSGNCFLYETYKSLRGPSGTYWTVGSSAKYDLNAFALRPETWTSADAAGFPIFPGLVRWEEVAAGEIAHAIRFTLSSVFGATAPPSPFPKGYIWPARHRASGTNASRPPYGARFRLKSTYDVEGSGFLPEVKVILRAFQRYGMVLADQGSNWYFSGVTSPNWTSQMFTQVRIAAANFEAVDTTLLMIDEDSAQATQPGGAPQDLSFDGRSDVLLRGPGGEIVAWLMNGDAITQSTLLLGAGTGYQATHFGDFNADGRADLLLAGPGGEIIVWLMNGTTVASSTLVLSGGTGYSVERIGDFNGDGRADILLRHTDGTLVAWLMDGATVTTSAVVLGAGTGFVPKAVGDFDGDNRDDIALAHSDGRITMWLMNGTAVASSADLLGAGTGYTLSHVGDFNNDAKDDLLLKGPGGEIVMWLMNGTTIASSALLAGATPWQVTHAGDLDSDGRADIVLKGLAGEIVVWLMNGATIANSTLLYGGGAWQVTQTGDHNGDLKRDLLLKGPGGEIVVWLMNGSTITSATLLVGATAWMAAP